MKILLAVDGSQYSEAAATTIESQFKPAESEVLLVHAIEPAAFFEQDASIRHRSTHAKELLARTAQELHAAGFRSVSTQVVEADARTGILSVATDWHPDLIVLGSHGRKGLEKLMLGSVAESVARHSTCSVLIVRPAAAHSAHS